MTSGKSEIRLGFEHSYAENLPGFYVSVTPAPAPRPRLLQFNSALADELGLDVQNLNEASLEQLFSGSQLPEDARPIAQAYAGHQFGNFVPQLGDGRAHLLGELIGRDGKRHDVALKGSGRTPFSRGGDGKAAVGPVLREYLIGEAMHALGIPTTRALVAVGTGEPVMRETPLPGAVLTRVAASHVRVGTFQFFAVRQQVDEVQKLADYVIQRHYPDLESESNRYLALLRGVVDRQATLIAKWMLVGFIHGVMNTDNMTISGETIDYGPCAFMETYNPGAVFSSIDYAGRYAYENQPAIAPWNLARFAETLLPLLEKEVSSGEAVTEATEVLETFMPTFQKHWYEGAKAKLGLVDDNDTGSVSDSERQLIDDWFELLAKSQVDYTLAWRGLAGEVGGGPQKLHSMFTDLAGLEKWLQRWRDLQKGIPASVVLDAILAANPLYIPRNHLVEEALTAASECGDLALFENLLAVLQRPFQDDPDQARYALPASPEFTSAYRTFCGT